MGSSDNQSIYSIWQNQIRINRRNPKNLFTMSNSVRGQKLWLRKLRFLRRRRKLRRSFRSIVFTNALDVWWSRTGSNRRPPACKAGALPTELRPRKAMVGPGRFELPTSRLSGVRSNQLSYGPPRTAGIIQLSKDRALEPGHEVKLACQRSPALYATTT